MKKRVVAHRHAFDLTSRFSRMLDEAGVSASDLLTEDGRWKLNRVVSTQQFFSVSHVTVDDRGDAVLVHIHFITPMRGEVQVYLPKIDRVRTVKM